MSRRGEQYENDINRNGRKGLVGQKRIIRTKLQNPYNKRWQLRLQNARPVIENIQ